jgi:tRNA pseudouridine38-40 synthase
MRWALLIEYDGGGFAGWQRQGALTTVQSVLEAAASRLCGGAMVASIVAGRTDSGVHAIGQVAMLALPDTLDARQVRDALNFHLKPHRVAIRAAAPAPPGWNPRFSALSRSYRYRILDRPARPALEAGRVWHVPRPLDVAAMHAAAQMLVGHHDFTSFRASACQAKSPVRTLDRLTVSRAGERIEILAEARSFLHHQVRNMVGTLRLVGDGRWEARDVATALAARARSAGGPTAPPEGLTMMRVVYAQDPFAALSSNQGS